MKKIFFYSALIAFLVSCSNADNQKDELVKLKAQRDQLNTEIAKIEADFNPDSNSSAIKSVSVTAAPATVGVFNHFIQVQGTVNGDQNIAVSPQMPGLVSVVYVKEGDRVKKGQLLAELDAQVMLQSISEVKTQLDMANIVFERQSALWDKKIGSEIQYLQAKSNKESLEKRLATLQEQLKMAKIISPINGTVESVPLKVGQMASPGLPTSAIRVMNMSTAKISAEVPEAYATRISKGNQVLVSFPDQGIELETKLNFTSHFIDPTNRTFTVECKITPKEVELRANMIAYLKIKDYTNEKTFCLPVNYVQSNRDGKFIFIATQNGKDWIAEKRMIKTGMDYDGIVEVLDGISVGDHIITSGYQNLNDGEKVNF